MDFAALPPEINSGRMYTGAGAGSMWAAATAWDGLGAELSSAASSYRSVVTGLTRGPWLGPASTSMLAAAAPYATWMSTTAEQAKQVANQAKSAAAAYEAAFAATVPPAVVEQNRAQLMSLVATNILGQNSPAIAVTETHYAEMWAQDAAAMYGYASTSAAASTLTPFTAPPQNTDPAGTGNQAGVVGQAVASSTAGNTPAALSQLVSTVPNVLEGLASGGTSTGTVSDFLNFTSGWTFIASGVLFILGPLLTGPIAGALPATALGAVGPALAAAGGAALVGDNAPALGNGAGMSLGTSRTGVLAGLGRAASIGGLAVPPTWAGAAPAIPRAATVLPEPVLASLPEADVDGLGPGYGGMLPGSLMAAAAGGGGAAGGGFAATRGAGAAQRGAPGQPAGGPGQPGGATPPGGPTRTRYGPPPAMIPQVARAQEGSSAAWPDPRAQQVEGPSNANLREEINELRKQLADLALEREVLMRSLALWARGPAEQ